MSPRALASPATVFVTPLEAAELLGISRNLVYRLLDEGELEEKRIGGRRYIYRSSLDHYTEMSDAG